MLLRPGHSKVTCHMRDLVRTGEQFGVNDLQVKTCGFPPLEDREKSLAMLTGIDFFGGGSLTKEEIVSFENHC